MDEPSVLDYLKSKIAPWKYPPVRIPEETLPGEAPLVQTETERVQEPETSPPYEVEPPPQGGLGGEPSRQKESGVTAFLPWLTILSLGLAILAQLTFEPAPNRSWIPGLVLYILALMLAIVAHLRGQWELVPYSQVNVAKEPLTIRVYPLIGGLALALVSFVLFSGNRFSIFNLAMLTISLLLVVWSFWIPGDKRGGREKGYFAPTLDKQWSLNISTWTVLVLGAFLLAAFFRFYKLDQVPPEMNSDHAEKILDVLRVLSGQTMIFFPTNGGREALQFYLVAGLHKFFGSELNFMALKTVTTLVGFLSLLFTYLLGKDLYNRRVGLLAVLFSGVAYWPNVVSRVGLRLPFYIFFTAALLFFLLKGIRTGRRNYFILAGISLGLSFYGYSADRILPVLVVVAVVIFLLHKHSKQHRKQVIVSFVALVVLAGIIFIPMLRFMVEDPTSFLFRTLSRVSTAERSLPGPAWQIFTSNLGRALVMFSWDNGEIWPISIPHRPALDIISGALFWIGIVLLIIRYVRKRNWIDLFLLISIPILMLPSILALAFPAENPNLYRTGGALVPVFLIIALSVDGLMSSLSKSYSPLGSKLAWGLAVVLIALSATHSYRLVFDQYAKQYALSAWNSSEMGNVVYDFNETFGNIENAWVMAYPYWVDTRLIFMIAGYPTKNNVLFPEDLQTFPDNPEPKIFLIKPEDTTSMSLLIEKYPRGWMKEYVSETPGKNFFIYYVPPSEE